MTLTLECGHVLELLPADGVVPYRRACYECAPAPADAGAWRIPTIRLVVAVDA